MTRAYTDQPDRGGASAVADHLSAGDEGLQMIPAVLSGVEPRSLCHDGVLSSQRSVQAADQRGDAGAIATTGH